MVFYIFVDRYSLSSKYFLCGMPERTSAYTTVRFVYLSFCIRNCECEYNCTARLPQFEGIYHENNNNNTYFLPMSLLHKLGTSYHAGSKTAYISIE